jgi:hypothetical protein
MSRHRTLITLLTSLSLIGSEMGQPRAKAPSKTVALHGRAVIGSFTQGREAGEQMRKKMNRDDALTRRFSQARGGNGKLLA